MICFYISLKLAYVCEYAPCEPHWFLLCNLEVFIPSFKNTPRITAHVGTTTSNLLQKQTIHLHEIFFPGRSGASVHRVCVCVLWGLLLPALLPWCPVRVPGTFAQYQAFQSCFQVLKCWSAKFTKGIGKQSKCGRKGIDEWCWWMGRNDAFLLVDTAGMTWMEVMDAEINEVTFLFGIVYIPVTVTERRSGNLYN